MAFLKSLSVEAVSLGVHLAAGAHEILLQTEYILTSIPMSVPLSEIKRKKTDVRTNQPENAQEGIQQVCIFMHPVIKLYCWVHFAASNASLFFMILGFILLNDNVKFWCYKLTNGQSDLFVHLCIRWY